MTDIPIQYTVYIICIQIQFVRLAIFSSSYIIVINKHNKDLILIILLYLMTLWSSKYNSLNHHKKKKPPHIRNFSNLIKIQQFFYE